MIHCYNRAYEIHTCTLLPHIPQVSVSLIQVNRHYIIILQVTLKHRFIRWKLSIVFRPLTSLSLKFQNFLEKKKNVD